MPSRDALEFIDKHELYILSLPKIPQGILSDSEKILRVWNDSKLQEWLQN